MLLIWYSCFVGFDRKTLIMHSEILIPLIPRRQSIMTAAAMDAVTMIRTFVTKGMSPIRNIRMIVDITASIQFRFPKPINLWDCITFLGIRSILSSSCDAISTPIIQNIVNFKSMDIITTAKPKQKVVHRGLLFKGRYVY